MKRKEHIYVLGTGTSHDGSACLLKDGKICVAIAKERVTRKKHDGGNDAAAIKYCLDAEGITIHDVDLIVQNANFGSFKYGSGYLRGPRLFDEDMGIPIVTISHHLAHAYSTIGTCPFENANILVIDGCGNAYEDCIDLQGAIVPDIERIRTVPHLFFEKDSFYRFENGRYTPLMKDFSEWGYTWNNYPLYLTNTKHSIGGLYGDVSIYCFGDFGDSGKLMGLAPYGRPGVFKEDIFELKDGRVFVNYDWMGKYRNPSRSYADFKKGFQHYADIAYGVQKEVERAIAYVVNCRMDAFPADRLCYSGGVALNAVANSKLLSDSGIRDLYIEPAAGDDGLSLGCAFYGWMEVLGRERGRHDRSTCFGTSYSDARVTEDIELFNLRTNSGIVGKGIDLLFEHLISGANTGGGMHAVFQFDLAGFGSRFLVLDGGAELRTEFDGRPTCIIEAEAGDLLYVLMYPRYSPQMLSSGKIKVSNLADMDLLTKKISSDEFAPELRSVILSDRSRKGGPVIYKPDKHYIRETAKLLSEGKTIGWFQDGCEFGPRALGRRSILADPRYPQARAYINSKIKFREDFRPFAPSVLKEDVSLYFETDRESPYMLLISKVRENYKDMLSSVVHADNTCRVQTVTPDWSPKFYELLQEFKRITGLSVLLNTSFNRRGMPIVETPGDAIDFFYSCGLDYLVINEFIIGKEVGVARKEQKKVVI